MPTQDPEQPQAEPAQAFVGVPFLASGTLGKIAPALLAAQRKLKNPEKNAKNPHFGNRYADLGATLEAAKDALNGQNIALSQVFSPSPYGTIAVTTLLLHSSGEYIGGTTHLPLDRDNAQGAGSAATYARRYGAQAIVGMYAEDDDDGNAASGKEDRDAGEDDKPTPKRKGLFGR